MATTVGLIFEPADEISAELEKERIGEDTEEELVEDE